MPSCRDGITGAFAPLDLSTQIRPAVPLRPVAFLLLRLQRDAAEKRPGWPSVGIRPCQMKRAGLSEAVSPVQSHQSKFLLLVVIFAVGDTFLSLAAIYSGLPSWI